MLNHGAEAFLQPDRASVSPNSAHKAYAMATRTAGDVLVETLIKRNVDTVFGLPGDGINGIIEALRARQDRIRFIQIRHEEAAAFNACGYAKWTGKLGVCLGTSGPGGIHLLNGLYDAKLEGSRAGDYRPAISRSRRHWRSEASTRRCGRRGLAKCDAASAA